MSDSTRVKPIVWTIASSDSGGGAGIQAAGATLRGDGLTDHEALHRDRPPGIEDRQPPAWR